MTKPGVRGLRALDLSYQRLTSLQPLGFRRNAAFPNSADCRIMRFCNFFSLEINILWNSLPKYIFFYYFDWRFMTNFNWIWMFFSVLGLKRFNPLCKANTEQNKLLYYLISCEIESAVFVWNCEFWSEIFLFVFLALMNFFYTLVLKTVRREGSWTTPPPPSPLTEQIFLYNMNTFYVV